MIISCPSCETSFKADAASLGPNGRRVRCSKCGHVWHAEPEAGNASAAPPTEPAVQKMKSQERPESRHEPVLTARDPDEENGGGDDGAGQDDGDTGAGEDEEIGADGLTAEQRAKLAAARQNKKQPRGKRFWFRVLLVFLIVAGILAVVQNMLSKPGMKKAGPAVEQPANVAPVDAKPVPPETDSDQSGGHIVGDPPPEPPKPAE